MQHGLVQHPSFCSSSNSSSPADSAPIAVAAPVAASAAAAAAGAAAPAGAAPVAALVGRFRRLKTTDASTSFGRSVCRRCASFCVNDRRMTSSTKGQKASLSQSPSLVRPENRLLLRRVSPLRPGQRLHELLFGGVPLRAHAPLLLVVIIVIPFLPQLRIEVH